MTQQTDFIVIGAGSAGCVVARVLAERGLDVTIIEAGQDIPVNRSPAKYVQAFGSDEDWGYQTVPQSHLASRRIRWPRGRGPGGSTRINATIWYPPTDQDFQEISAAGGASWNEHALRTSFADVAKWVSPEPPRWISTATQTFVQTAGSMGLAAHAFSRMTRSGRRRTAFDMLKESEAWPSIKQVQGHVTRIEFDGQRAREVHVIDTVTHQPIVLQAQQAVILCSGTIGSAELLLRSGIGPSQMLIEAGVEVVCEADEVGENLSDHLIMPLIFSVAPAHRFATEPSVQDLARFQISGTGPLASNLAESGMLHDVEGNCFQLHVTPTHYLLHPDRRAPAAMTLGVNISKPASHGNIRLRPASHSLAPELEIDPRYLTEPEDLRQLVAAIEFTREIARQSPLSSFVCDELIPGVRRGGEDATLKAIARLAQTLYHPTGTCRMGLDGKSVVDERLAVRGVSGLQVIDASILPTIPSVNPNALVMTIAMHAAKLLASSF